VTREGRILALRLDQLEDYGAFLRAPMPEITVPEAAAQ